LRPDGSVVQAYFSLIDIVCLTEAECQSVAFSVDEQNTEREPLAFVQVLYGIHPGWKLRKVDESLLTRTAFTFPLT
jgi:hypothetical protein